MNRKLAYTPSQRATFVDLIIDYEQQVLTRLQVRFGESQHDPVTYAILRAVYRLNVSGKPGTVPALAEGTGLSQVTVWRRLRALAQGGHIKTTPHRGARGQDIWIADDMAEEAAYILETHMDRFAAKLVNLEAEAALDPLAGKVAPFAPGFDQRAPRA